MAGGWIKMHRKILEWEWFKDPPARDLFIFLLLSAAFEETEVDGIILHPGEYLGSLREIAKTLGFSHQQLRTALGKLEKTGEVEALSGKSLIQALTRGSTQTPTQGATHPTIRNRTLFKVKNWSEYQASNTNSNTNSNTRSNTTPQNPSLYSIKEDIRSIKEEGETPAPDPQPKPARKRKLFVPPTLAEVAAYCQERKNAVDPQRFIDYYESCGWMRGKSKIKDWKACVRTWERNQYSKPNGQESKAPMPGWYYQEDPGVMSPELLEEIHELQRKTFGSKEREE